jgi:hypothetical protein
VSLLYTHSPAHTSRRYTFDEIYSWGASDLQTFEFRVASERLPYSFKTMHAQEIEQKLEARPPPPPLVLNGHAASLTPY